MYKLKSISNFIIENYNTYTGDEVAQHVKDITPDESDIPDYFIDKYIKPNDGWVLKKINLKKLLKTDKSFAEYYNSGEVRYHDDEVNYKDLDNELVVYKGTLLDGYSRASTLIRIGDKTAYAYIFK